MKRIGFTISILTILFALIMGNLSCMQRKPALKYKLKEDTKFIMIFSENDHYIREIMGNEIVTNTDDEIEYSFRVKSEKRDGADLEMAYRKRTHKTNDAQFDNSVDFSGLIGKKAGFFLSSNGAPSKFQGYDNYPAIEIPDQQFTLTPVSYINETKRLFPPLPDKAIDVGETWTSTLEYSEKVADGKVMVTIESMYTLIEETVKDGIACMKIDSKYDLSVNGDVKAEGMKIIIHLLGDGNDVIYFAHKKGMLYNVEGDYNLKGKGIIDELNLEIPMDHHYKKKINVEFD